MQVQALIAALDEEIARLRQARELIGGTTEVKRRGRPKGSTNKSAGTSAPSKAKATRAAAGGARPRRQMSAEGKARIAAAQKARWAAQKEAGSAKKTRGPKPGAAKAKAGDALDGRTRAGRAAKAAAAARKTGRGPGKRTATPPMPPPSGAPEVSAQA